MYLKYYGSFIDPLTAGGAADPDKKWWQLMLALAPAATVGFLSGCNPMLNPNILPISEKEKIKTLVSGFNWATFEIKGKNQLLMSLPGCPDDKNPQNKIAGIAIDLAKLKKEYPNQKQIKITDLKVPGPFLIVVQGKDYKETDAKPSPHQRVYFLEEGYDTAKDGDLVIDLGEVPVNAWDNYSYSQNVTVAITGNDPENVATVSFNGEKEFFSVDLRAMTTAILQDIKLGKIKSHQPSYPKQVVVNLDRELTDTWVSLFDETAMAEYAAAKKENRPVNQELLDQHTFRQKMNLTKGDNKFTIDQFPVTENIHFGGKAIRSSINNDNTITVKLPANGQNFVGYPYQDDKTVDLAQLKNNSQLVFTADNDDITIVLNDDQGNYVTYQGKTTDEQGNIVSGLRKISLSNFVDFIRLSSSKNTPTSLITQDVDEQNQKVQRAVIELSPQETVAFPFRVAGEELNLGKDDTIKFTVTKTADQNLLSIFENTFFNFVSGSQGKVTYGVSLYELLNYQLLCGNQDLIASLSGFVTNDLLTKLANKERLTENEKVIVQNGLKKMLRTVTSYNINFQLIELINKAASMQYISDGQKFNLKELQLINNDKEKATNFKVENFQLAKHQNFELFKFNWSAVKSAGVYYNGATEIDVKLGTNFILQNDNQTKAEFAAKFYGKDCDRTKIAGISISPEKEVQNVGIQVKCQTEQGTEQAVDLIVQKSGTEKIASEADKIILLNLSNQKVDSPVKFNAGEGTLFAK